MTTTTKPAWEATAEADDELLSSEDLVTEVLVIQGKATLSHVGYASIANRCGISITDLEAKDTDEGILVSVSGKNEAGEVRHACHMQPRSNKASEKPFDWAKAYSKAQRNLFKMFLYGHPLVKETIEKATAPKPAPKPSVLEATKTECRALWHDKQFEAEVARLGITKEVVLETAEDVWGPREKWGVTKWKHWKQSLTGFGGQKGLLHTRLTDGNQDEPQEDTPAEDVDTDGVNF